MQGADFEEQSVQAMCAWLQERGLTQWCELHFGGSLEMASSLQEADDFTEMLHVLANSEGAKALTIRVSMLLLMLLFKLE